MYIFMRMGTDMHVCIITVVKCIHLDITCCLFVLQTKLFKINSDNGIITLAKSLDYETEKKHTLVVIARVRNEQSTSLIVSVQVCSAKSSSYTLQLVQRYSSYIDRSLACSHDFDWKFYYFEPPMTA